MSIRRFLVPALGLGLAACAGVQTDHRAVAQNRPPEIRDAPHAPSSGPAHGGWYALNYPYYWQPGPRVDFDEPYDYNGNYFPLR